MPPRQHATQQIIGIALDPANGHIACSPGLTNVQPHCDMLQLGALQLVDGARIPWPDGIRCDRHAFVDATSRHRIACRPLELLAHCRLKALLSSVELDATVPRIVAAFLCEAKFQPCRLHSLQAAIVTYVMMYGRAFNYVCLLTGV